MNNSGKGPPSASCQHFHGTNLSANNLLSTPPLLGQRVVNGLDYCMVSVKPSKAQRQLHQKSPHHVQVETEYMEAVDNLMAAKYGHIKKQNSPENDGNGYDNPVNGIQPSFHGAGVQRYVGGHDYRMSSKLSPAREGTRSEMRRQLHIELDQLTTPADDNILLPKLELSHGDPKGQYIPDD